MNSLQRRPTLAQRIALVREAVRGIWQGPISSSDPNLREFFGGNITTTAGVSVSEGSALTVAAVWNAVNCISGDIAALPLNMYRRFDGGKEKFLNNPLHRLVHDQPNPEMTSIAWRRTVQAHVLTWGNGYSEIVRDGSGRPAQFWPITPDRVTPYRRGIDSGLEYRIVNRDGSDSFIPSADMLHVYGLGFDGIQGYSVIAKARESIGLGMAAERFGESLYGNGLAIGGVISFPGAKPPELSDQNYIASLNSKHQGVDRAHKLLALYNGAKYERMNIPPNDAQFLETRTFQLAEVARWFNLPPHKIGDLHRATFSNIEQQTIDYYTGCLLPWLKTWEQELFQKLVPSSERNIQFFEHVVDGLLRGDSQMRADSFSKRFSTASITPNEIRDSENLNPLTGGDISFVPLNTIPLSKVEAWFDADIDEKKAKAEQARRPPPTPVAPASPAADPNKVREIELLTEARDTARRCAQEAEDAKDVIAAELATVKAELAHRQAERDSERAAWATEREAQAATIDTVLGEVTAAQSQLQEAEDAKDVIAAELATVKTELAHSDTERHAAVVASATAAEESRQWKEAITRDLEIAKANGFRFEKDAADAQSEIERLTSQATSLGTDLTAATRDLTAAVERAALIEADYQRVCTERIDIEAQRDVALAANRSMEVELETVMARTEALSADVAAAKQETAKAEERIAVVEADAVRLTEARAHADEVNQATVTELRGQVAAATQELGTATTALLEAKTSIGALEATRETERAARDVSEATVTAQTDRLTALQARLSATQQAIRGTLVDAVNRLIAKETERARKAQGSPAKLGAWVETFYPIHEDFCRVAMKPAVRALLVAHGSEADVDRVLDRIVLSHVSESSRQLQGVLQDADSESLAPALERVLRRWESERAEALADRIIKEAA